MAGSIWVREIKKNRIIRDVTAACPDGDWESALAQACRSLDIAVPMVVRRHYKDFEDFRQLRFLPEHFLEPVPFDRLEVEFFDPDDRKKRT